MITADPKQKNYQKISADDSKKEISKIKYHSLLVSISLPAAFDGLGYGILTFSQLVSSIYSLNLMRPNPSTLKQYNTLFPLLVGPALAGLGVTALGFDENKELLDESLNKKNKTPIKNRTEDVKSSADNQRISSTRKSILTIFCNHPSEIFCLTIGATVNGVIIFSNLGSVMSQFEINFLNSPFYYLGVAFSACISLQFMLLNGSNLIRLVENGSPVPAYTHKINNLLLRYLAILAVNGLPIISTVTMGSLGASESYQLTRDILSQIDQQDIAARIAWLPAIILGSIAAACHYAVYGVRFKEFLAEKIRGDSHYKTVPSDSLIHGIKKILLYSTVVLISSTAIVIGFGALDDMIYIVKYNKSPDVSLIENSGLPAILPLWGKLLVYGLPALVYGLETYATEGQRFLKLSGVIKYCKERDLLLPPKNENQTQNAKITSLERLLKNILTMVAVGGVKTLIELLIIPDSVEPNEMTWKQNATIAVITGLVAALWSAIIMKPEMVRRELKTRLEEEKKSKESENQKESSQLIEDMVDNISFCQKRWIFGFILQGAFVGGVTYGTQALIQNVWLDPVGSDEDRLDNAQVISAIIAGITSIATQVFVLRGGEFGKNLSNWNWKQKAGNLCSGASSFGRNCMAFFSSSGRKKANYVPLGNDQKETMNQILH